MRRAQWARIHGKPPQLTRCTNCAAPVRPHYVCLECGIYGGEQIVEGRQSGDAGE